MEDNINPAEGNSIVTPGEYKIGLYVTVFKWKSSHKPERQDSPLFIISQLKQDPKGEFYNSLMGSIIKIQGISLPYLACSIESHKDKPMVSIDTREVVLMELKLQYVTAILDRD